MLRNSSFASLVAVAILFLVSPAQAQAVAQFDLPSQPLATALRALGSQTSTNVLFDPPLVEGRDTPALKAELTLDQAFARVLAGSGLKHRFLDDKTVMVISAKDAAKPTAAAADVGPALRLVQEDQARTEMQKVEQGKSNSSSAGSEVSSETSDESNKGIPEVLVKGAKTLNTDIKRSVDDPQPYVVFDRRKIERSGARNVQDFLKNNLTMSTTMVSPGQTFAGLVGDTSSINLRGLGTGQTLILVDGRRLANVMSGATPLQPDLNGIPLSAIERIEVLPSTASGIYGGGATGGVINVILRRDYQGADAKVTYANSFDSDSAVRQFDLSSGFSLEEGRTRILLAGTYSQQNALEVSARDLSQRAHFRMLANNPAYLNSSTVLPLGYTSNIRSANGSNLVLKQNNTPLNSSFTFVPAGYAGPSTDNGLALVGNAGRYNTELSTTPQTGFLLPGGEDSFYNAPTVKSLTASVRRSFTPKVDAFVEAFGSNSVARTNMNLSLLAPVTLAVSAPNNPFTTPILVQVADDSASGDLISQINTRRVGGGVIVRLPRSWISAAEFTWSRASVFWQYPPGSIMPTAITNLLTSGAVDVMRDMNVYGGLSPSLWPAYGQRLTTPYLSTTRNSTLRFSGPVAELPAGSIALSAALEYRDDRLDAGIANILEANGSFRDSLTPDRSVSVASGYLEARIPLARELEAQLAFRHDAYTTNGTNASINLATDPTGASIIRVRNKSRSTNPTVALRYQMIQDVALRASYGTGFLPPAVNQLAPAAPLTSSSTFTDPRRGGSGPTGSYTLYSGGNAQLDPEESKNWSAGVILTPRFLPALRLSVDYSQFDKTDNIITPALQQIINNEASLPGRVTRGANLSTDPAGWEGPITAVDISLVNVSRAKIKAYDAQLNYELNFPVLGSFAWATTATWQTHYQTQVVPDSPFVENVGYRGQPLRFKADAGLTWTRAEWSAGWNSHYFDSYLVYGPTDAASRVTLLASTQGNGGRIPAQVYHDVFASYKFERLGGRVLGLLSDTQIQAGIKNLLNTKPPVDILSTFSGSSLYGDPRLATYYLSLKKSF